MLTWTEKGERLDAEMQIREQSLGLQHPDTAETIHDLAAFQETQGNREEALSLFQQVLAVREQVFGSEHPKTKAVHQRLTILRQLVSQERC